MNNYISVETMEHLLFVIVTLSTVTVLSFLFRKIINVFIKRNSSILGVSPTTFVFFKNSISFVLYTLAIFWIFHKIPYFHSLGTTLFAGAGVLVAIIGFASQKAFSNIIGGLFILIFKPFRIGDVIEVSNSRKGTVESITLRHIVIRDFESRRIVIPNSVISDETIVNSNLTDEKIRKHIAFQISYESNVELAKKIILDSIRNHPLYLDNRTVEEINTDVPDVLIRMTELGDSGVSLKAYAWTNNFEDGFNLYCETLEIVKKKFEENGIEIPYPHRTITYKNSDITSAESI